MPGSLSLIHISFSYEDDAEPALRNVSLEIPAGTVCAVVGPSGSGKSTLANLVARFWDVDSGQEMCIRDRATPPWSTSAECAS